MANQSTTEKADQRLIENIDQVLNFATKIQSEAYRPIKTGLNFYDDLMDGGAMPQTLTILLAAQGAGKTILLQQLAESIAAQHKMHVVYLNFEMPTEQLLARAISARIYKRGNMKLTQKQIMRGYQWTEAQRAEILETIEEYEQEAFYISYNPKGIHADIEEIQGYLKELTENHDSGAPAPILFVDYLQLIQSKNKEYKDVKDRLTQVLLDLKEYAIHNNTCVYLISAVNRQSMENVNVNSARDTSAIEYQADYLFALENYKDQAAANSEGLQRMVLKLLKSRDGQSGLYSIVNRNGKYNLFPPEKCEYKGAYVKTGKKTTKEDVPQMYKALEKLTGVYGEGTETQEEF